MGEEGEKGESGSRVEFWALENPHDGQEDRRLGIKALAAPWGAQLSPPPIHSINSSPTLARLAGPQKVSSINHTQHPVCTTITFWILQNPGLFQRHSLGNKYSPPQSCIKLL